MTKLRGAHSIGSPRFAEARRHELDFRLILFTGIITEMNTKHRRTLAAIFVRPISSDIRWLDVESLLVALGAECSEGRGARVRFRLNGEEAVFHRPHPSPGTDKGALKAVQRFLEMAGVNHEHDNA